jgi:CBS domain-containing protein
MKIETLLRRKGSQILTVKPDATVFDVVSLLRQHRTGCVVVSRDGKHIDGIVAVRDIAYAMAERADRIRRALGADILDAPISRIMTREVHTCRQEDTLRQIMNEMTHQHLLHVPVVNSEGELSGIVSTDDVVKFAVDEMELERGVLHDSLLMLQTLKHLH